VMGDVACRTYSLTWGGGMLCTSTLSRLFHFWCGKKEKRGQRGACEHMVWMHHQYMKYMNTCDVILEDLVPLWTQTSIQIKPKQILVITFSFENGLSM
jgi:hypothetical protein